MKMLRDLRLLIVVALSGTLCTLFFFFFFFDIDGIVVRVPVPERTSVIRIFYKEKVLTLVIQHYVTKGPWTGVGGICLT